MMTKLVRNYIVEVEGASTMIYRALTEREFYPIKQNLLIETPVIEITESECYLV